MEAIHALASLLGSLSPAQYCQAYYLLVAVVILSFHVLPQDLRGALLDYGARQRNPNTQGSDSNTQTRKTLASLIRCLEVPHSWFLHFYILSVLGSAFWAWQYITRGSVMEAIAKAQVVNDGNQAVELGNVLVAWALMATQGTRRLYESLVVTKAGKSPMSGIHWLVGLAYYACMSVSVWVEGSGAILNSWNTSLLPDPPSRRAILAIAIFIFASLKQNECHRHLAGLKKYTLPYRGWFQYIVCPHYTSECLIYVALSLAASPPGRVVNSTVFTGLLFVAVNLGITANATQKWYADKFGAAKVASRWKMIPFIF